MSVKKLLMAALTLMLTSPTPTECENPPPTFRLPIRIVAGPTTVSSIVINTLKPLYWRPTNAVVAGPSTVASAVWNGPALGPARI